MPAFVPHPALSIEKRQAILTSARSAREHAAAVRPQLPDVLVRAAELRHAAHAQRLRLRLAARRRAADR